MQLDKIHIHRNTRSHTEGVKLSMRSVQLLAFPWVAIIGLLMFLFVVAAPLRVRAQSQGPLARIASPANKQEMKGSVTILGTAQSESLVRYELAFASEPDLANWTVFGGATQSVNTAGLGVWNTRPLPDGEYALRLQVFSSNGSVIETVVRNLKLINGNTGAAAAPDNNNNTNSNATEAQPAATKETPRVSSFSFSDIPTAFMRGVRYAVLGFGGFAAYLLLKLALRFLRKRVSDTRIDYGS